MVDGVRDMNHPHYRYNPLPLSQHPDLPVNHRTQHSPVFFATVVVYVGGQYENLVKCQVRHHHLMRLECHQTLDLCQELHWRAKVQLTKGYLQHPCGQIALIYS